jgi:hypothetical protein
VQLPHGLDKAARGVHLQDNYGGVFLFGLFYALYDIITDCRSDGAFDIQQDGLSSFIGVGN